MILYKVIIAKIQREIISSEGISVESFPLFFDYILSNDFETAKYIADNYSRLPFIEIERTKEYPKYFTHTLN